ncbi:DNA topoisomerase 1 [Chlamydiales bacterium SCGC AG-110-P3]|nr:DNA topoisomerase 1 [Chlamydiales bacterium SCGC AG-110-P3]
MAKKTGKSLIIVESPAKMKTLRKFLGPDFLFESSVGHIRDLPEREFGIDLENNFEPSYELLPEKQQVIKKLRDAAKQVETVYLSPDPDREGEAIAWHITHILPEDTNIKRVTFNSITQDAVQKALEEPRSIDQAMVNAQQARRLLDRMVGYKISPILNRRMQRGRSGSVSAGRVQSVALKLVVDREKEIEAFNTVEYWNLGTILKTDTEKREFQANLYSVDSRRIGKEAVEGKELFLIPNEETATSIVDRLKNTTYTISKVERKEKRRNPVAPFITSTLQQEASRHHGFSSAKTMNVAQGLYEGVDMGTEGIEGLITYMRTDSVRIVPEALEEARNHIKQVYGPNFLPEKAKIYSTKKSAQDAHEAIRPTNIGHPPEKIKSFLTREQFLLYSLIWKRFIASQMLPAIYDTVTADIATDNDIILRATGSRIKFQGFLAVYEEKDDEDDPIEKDDKLLPDLQEGQPLALIDVLSEQAFTKPPPRFSEASLVKELEKCGIGRPSTYSTIMNKIQSREYTTKENARLKPTDLGRVIAEMLEANFEQIMNVDFTARMENSLEEIAADKKNWKDLIGEFWKEFEPTLEHAEKHAYPPKVPTDIDCPECKKKLQKVWFRDKYFYGCSGYPECHYTVPVEEYSFKKEDYAEDFDWDQKCPNCEAAMKVRYGRYGAFLGCTSYPDCKGIINIPAKGEEYIPPEDMPECPAVGCTGHIVARKSRYGKTFYSCSEFPACDVIVNELTQLTEKYPEHPKTPYVKKTKKGKGKAAGKKGKAAKKAEKKNHVNRARCRQRNSHRSFKLS